MARPTVSYVITLYNKATYLPHVLAGLAGQMGDFDRQFIFVDDGSTDNTVSIIRSFDGLSGDIHIIEQKNTGPAVALNRGLAMATGDFIKPVDGDDVLMPWATAHLMGACEQSGASIAYAHMPFQQKYSLLIPPIQFISSYTEPTLAITVNPDFLKAVLTRPQTNPTSWMAHRDVVTRGIGCDPGVFIQDYSIELQLAYHGTAVRVDIFLMATPDFAPGRLSDNQAQILHDVNLALLRFLRATPELSPPLRHFALDRATARAWLGLQDMAINHYFQKIF